MALFGFFTRAVHYLTDDMPFELEVVDCKDWRPTIEVEPASEFLHPRPTIPFPVHIVNT